MIIVDTSALIAIIGEEPERFSFVDLMVRVPDIAMSAATFVETGIVYRSKFSGDDFDRLERLIEIAEIEIAPVDAGQARLAIEAYVRYGRGSGHKAQLNFGDCFSYALAKIRGAPLLFKGEDFAATDIEPALRS
ncbi:type II toxin-antitoxin system VapC family toxin [Fulvimarina sp. 2208YS6-2-32]|uniref:Ribonuclease VapC n=1 Tax=Fulvimarina uroteuthidis TaxID=3098149 RepID=A0ABU5I1I0_9HYPH|nr:type II toxin-antitoxin system VapC family toxin [Fulvimarina sp. 2208YS6-2-32]MDY8109228.1 type II toxin-antitoxin system VapC family toxin [Fulvimarina sp. 2208YS6-2-32]